MSNNLLPSLTSFSYGVCVNFAQIFILKKKIDLKNSLTDLYLVIRHLTPGECVAEKLCGLKFQSSMFLLIVE